MSAAPADEVPRARTLPSYFTRFVGRAEDLRLLRARVLAGIGRPATERLTVLLGLGGIGKTRLAVEFAGGLAAEPTVGDWFVDGIWWVDLAPVTAPEALPVAIARAAGLPGVSAADPLASLVRSLRSRHALVVMDNCEHLDGACRELWSALLPGCPGLIVLATSRVPMGQVHEVALAGLDSVSSEPTERRVGLSVAAELFYDRAGMLLPGYAHAASDGPAVEAICQRVGGLPLAIELAAPWMRTLAAPDLLTRIDRSLDLLTSDNSESMIRHRTIRTVLDGTWSSLSTEEQQVVRCLGAFVGGFSLEAAEEVAGATVSVLATLTDRAIIRRVPVLGDDTWYVTHEMIRQYAVDRLHELPATEVDTLRNRHLQHLMDRAECFEEARNGPQEQRWVARLIRDDGNIDSAVAWGLDRGSQALVLRLVAGMSHFWDFHSWSEREDRLILAAIELPYDATVAREVKARLTLLTFAAWIYFLGQRDRGRARTVFFDALTQYRQRGDSAGQQRCLLGLSHVAESESDHAGAARLARQSLSVCRRADDELGAALSVQRLAEIAFSEQDFAATERYLIDSVGEFRRLGLQWAVAGALHDMADLRRAQERWQEALVFFRQARDLIVELDSTKSIRNVLRDVAAVAVALDLLPLAARLFGASDAWDEMYGGFKRPMCVPPDTQRAKARSALGGQAWAVAHGQGLAMGEKSILSTLDGAISELQSLIESPLPAGLTAREGEVVLLLAEGASTEEIATGLVVSPRTVHAHLRSIFRKLGVSTRTAAVHEAGRLGLRGRRD